MARNTEKGGKWKMHTVGPGICEKLKILENENHTLYDVKYCGKNWKGGKWEKHTLGPGLWREKWKIVENGT